MSASLTDLERTGETDRATAVTAPPSRWRTRLLLPGLILAIAVALLLVTSARTLLPATPVRVVPVIVKVVEGAAGSVTVQAPGWIEPDPHPHYVAALADGVVEELLVLDGDRVEPDQIVARLVNDDAQLTLRRADAELRQRRSGVLAAHANLVAARAQLEHLVEPTRAVATGEAAVAGARAEIEKSKADTAVERARLLELQDEYDRKAQLTDSRAVSEATVARLRLRLDAQRAAVDAAAAREIVGAATLRRAEADLRAASTDLDLLIEERRAVALAEAAVGTAEASVALAEAARDEAALRLARMEVRSPVGGIVMRRLAAPGSKVTREGPENSSHVVHVYDPKRLQVRVDVPLADSAQVAIGQDVEISVEVLPDRTFAGRVTRVVHQADIQKNTVEIKVAIEDPSPELKPEMLARVRFIGRSPSGEGASVRQRVFAPSQLVREDGTGETVALVVTSLVGKRGRVERRAVVPGSRRIDGWIEIERGLQVGDLLIADGAGDVRPGERVRVIDEGEGG
jgi:RND family efflux transporter MFP subunit